MYLHEHRLHLIASTSEFELFIHCLAMPLQDLAQWRLRGQSTTVPGSLRLSSRALEAKWRDWAAQRYTRGNRTSVGLLSLLGPC